MSKAEKTLEKWLDNTPKEEPIDKVEAFIKRHFPDQHNQDSSSHIVITDELLKGIPGFGPMGDFSVPVKGGQKVKGYYLRMLAETVRLLQELRGTKKEEEE